MCSLFGVLPRGRGVLVCGCSKRICVCNAFPLVGHGLCNAFPLVGHGLGANLSFWVVCERRMYRLVVVTLLLFQEGHQESVMRFHVTILVEISCEETIPLPDGVSGLAVDVRQLLYFITRNEFVQRGSPCALDPGLEVCKSGGLTPRRRLF